MIFAQVIFFNFKYFIICKISWSGGNIVLMYASLYNNVPIVVNISGRFLLDKSIELHLGKGYEEKIAKEGFVELKKNSGNYHLIIYSNIP